MDNDGFGFGLIGRLKNTIESRMKNVKGSVYDVRDTVVKGKDFQPLGIAGGHLQGLRNANRELAPGLKDL